MNTLELQKIRHKFGLSRKELATRLGVTIETLNTWEYRTKIVPEDKVKRIEYVFNMYYEESTSTLIEKGSLEKDSSNPKSEIQPFLEKEGVKFYLKDACNLVAMNAEKAKNEEVLNNMFKLEALEIIKMSINEDGTFNLKKFLETS